MHKKAYRFFFTIKLRDLTLLSINGLIFLNELREYCGALAKKHENRLKCCLLKNKFDEMYDLID